LKPLQPAEPESAQETTAQKVKVKRRIRAANLEGHLPQAALKAAEAIWIERDCETIEDFITVLGTNDEELLSINNVGEKTLAALRDIFGVSADEPQDETSGAAELGDGSGQRQSVEFSASRESTGTEAASSVLSTTGQASGTMGRDFDLERVDAVSEKNPRYIIRFNVNVVSGEQHRIAEDQRTGELRCDCPEFIAAKDCPHVQAAKEKLMEL